MSNGVILLKRPYFSPNIAPRGSECKKTCIKSWPGNLFHVLNLTFDPCFKVVALKRPYFALIIGAVASDCKDRP